MVIKVKIQANIQSDEKKGSYIKKKKRGVEKFLVQLRREWVLKLIFWKIKETLEIICFVNQRTFSKTIIFNYS